ncbi:mannose-1-phosphate guanylyltransferase/mannose-6-phosphate isomerase [Candidatus Nitronereus thalassa]|uniref:mannose-1-phosphate guanylyltransferase n=1 Tax=Candidatus Nitronereus thalassa TaxID=3020898 RepID=A0ABU3K4E0_9BACT|nr:mannose-1-phosphate guanylyltransferase/mannose-6-phosphate isomerase [Candidatus Nitronereus thalassa]MDT7041264.1 mannose-1-phosphate guanylyltransferase/mannose-6-phosphate isomerase [Candidatus Nitronereus thalassa]
MKKQPHLYAVVLAGGSGTRFWPMSRERFPKQLLKIIGEETLIQQTVRRVMSSVPVNHICVVTNHFQAESIKLQLAQWKDELADNFVLEPEGRNTAPAIGLAALRLLRRDPDATMLVLPADHIIQGDAKFKNAISLGYEIAQKGNLVTFGIQPTKPETGYGYIQPNRRARLGKQGTLSGYKVARFVEKPDVKKAQQYLKSGNYFWNSGIFLWRASTVLEEFARHQPALLRGLKAVDEMMESGQFGNPFAARYKKLPSVSIDYGIMEQSSHSAVVPVNFSWSDVGSWGSLEEVAPCDKRGNVKTGNVVDLDSENTVFFTDKRLVGSIGLKDMVVVDTPDATLVCPKSRSQDVKKLVEELKRRGAPEHLEHLTIHRPWGSYTILEEGPGYKVKRISVLPGGRLSLQMHHKRSEHWVVIAGTARVTCGDTVSDLGPGKSIAIPVETKHRLENPGNDPLEIIEVQNGPYLGEDDIVRYQDDYGRTQTP